MVKKNIKYKWRERGLHFLYMLRMKIYNKKLYEESMKESIFKNLNILYSKNGVEISPS